MRLSHAIVVALAVPALLSAPAGARALAAKASVPWDKLEATSPDRVVAKAYAGRDDALQVRVRPGDSPTRSGERTEMVYTQAHSLGFEGQTATYRFSTRFPSGFNYVPGSTWNIFAQFHETDPDGCHPNLALQINAKKTPPVLRLQTRGGELDTATCEPEFTPSWDFGELRYDRWYDFALTVHWSADPAEGWVELSDGDRVVVPRKRTATLYPGQGVYFKQGFYRQASDFESLLFQTPVSSASRTR
ncbi:polysaccharide lyase [Solirubrobacter soli]|uniref:polysaccharide lyase n=1 Tax=Solirubrobacter soli TaxID=363832 RepID=UPI000425739E|nr:polysaccharide lyase [Solirubrobacter soli]